MRRRDFITLIGGAAATWPLAARAQTNRVRKIGVLLGGSENDAEMRAEVFALQKGLQELGWTEGRNVHFEFRWPNGDPDRTRAYAMEFVGLAPDVIVTGTTPAASVLQRPAGRKAIHVGCSPDSGSAVYGRLFVGQCHEPTLVAVANPARYLFDQARLRPFRYARSAMSLQSMIEARNC